VNPRKTREIVAALTTKGFQKHSTHHEMFWFHYGTRKTQVRTRISHGVSEYGKRLLCRVRNQMGLVDTELDSFIDCSLTAEGYAELLIHRKIITKTANPK
jgi:hypothetical protein